MSAPCIKVVGLYIKELRSIRELELPRDGLGWAGKFPDVVMIGGINGSGKTTLLDFFCECLKFFFSYREGDRSPFTKISTTTEAWVDFRIEFPDLIGEETDIIGVDIRILIGGEEFVHSYRTELCFGLVLVDEE